MTYQRGNAVAAAQTYRRSKTWCNIYGIFRRDGIELRFTDHTRALTIDGKVYMPIGSATMSAERRESGLKTGDVEATGYLSTEVVSAYAANSTGSNTSVTLNDTAANWAPNAWAGYTVENLANNETRVVMANTPTMLLLRSAWSSTPTTGAYRIRHQSIIYTDLIRGVYRDARVQTATIDWRRPYLKHYGQVRFMRDVRSDGHQWTISLESRAQVLQKPIGGDRGGIYTPTCPYKLGNLTTCKADITGDIQILGASGVSATVTSATPLVLTRSGTAWTTNQWVGYRCLITSGAGKGQERRIVANGAQTITLDVALDPVPINTNTFRIGQGYQVTTVVDARKEVQFSGMDAKLDDYFRDGEIEWTVGANAGVVSPVYQYTASTRNLVLLVPTPYPITTSDFGIIRPGCDGLVTTCRDKFNNVANFGGSPYDPGSGFVLSTPGRG